MYSAGGEDIIHLVLFVFLIDVQVRECNEFKCLRPKRIPTK